jgi:thiamine-phosphate pyrophosphorylase
MLLYYITDRKQFPGTEADRRAALLARIAETARAGVDLIQLREKDLEAGELAELGAEAVRRVRENSAHTRLLINSRTDAALAVGADGVHLTSADISAADVRALVAHATRRTKNEERGTRFTIGVSCHSAKEVRLAESHGADFAVLAPIFEKYGTAASPVGLTTLREASLYQQQPDLRVEAGDTRHHIAVLALGGITRDNAVLCVAAGAAGIAGIRLFQTGDIAATVAHLKR